MTELATSPLATSNSPAQNRRLSAPTVANENFLGSFKDLMDTINPLQQLPIVSSLYREFSDSTISDGARIAGGTLYGGPIGLVSAVINSVVKTVSGKDIGANLIAMITGDKNTELADASAGNNDYIPSSRKNSINSYVRAQSLLT